MSHYGKLGTETLSEDVRDIRGTTVRGADNKKLGTVSDVIFDHETMEVRYLVVDSGGWLEAGSFLLPADRVSVRENREEGITTGATRQQIENSPQYHSDVVKSGEDWKKYQQEFNKYWEEKPVLHMKDTYRIITPPEEPSDAPIHRSERSGSADTEVNVARLFPERMSDKFSDPAPGGGKVTLRPKSVARAEDAAAGVNMLKPRWWDAFENYLQIKKDEIQAKCSHCAEKAA